MLPDSVSMMEFEVRDLLWLLLPLAAASGWVAAHRDRRRRATAKFNGLSPEYFRGVNYLLNEQQDKAIEVFTQILEVNSETVETHLALGSLFRRRGEVERAIRIHQNLIARPTLEKTLRAQAVCELAQDYYKAGLLDRAEHLFLDLTDKPEHSEQALTALMQIYEQEKEWVKAIAAGRRLQAIAEGNLAPVLAQYHCELGELALSAKQYTQAGRFAADALVIDTRCVRASILAGHIAKEQGHDREAIVHWQNMELQNAEYLDEVIDELVAAYRRLNDEPQLYAYLQVVLNRQAGVRTVLAMADLIRARDGQHAAQVFIAERLRREPTVPVLKHLIDVQVLQGTASSHENLDLIKGILDRIAAQQDGYQCRQCGFRGLSLHWQCPACHEWITMQPASCSVPWVSSGFRDIAGQAVSAQARGGST